MSSAQNIPDLVVRKSSEQLNSPVEIVFLNKLFQLNHATSISTYYEIDVLELS